MARRRNIPSITFLIGGKFSLPSRGRGPFEEIPAFFWYMPNLPNSFYRFASRHWDLYGHNRFGTFGFNREKFFGWKDTSRPGYKAVRTAATELLDRCDRLRRDYGTTYFRFVGHSAGCLVANVATHHAEFDIDQLILCAPPVANKDGIPSGWTTEQLVESVPNVDRLAGGKFFYFHVAGDEVLAAHGVDTTYDTAYVRKKFPSVYAAARTPDPIPNEFGLLDHWTPVIPRTWRHPPHGGIPYLEWIDQQ
ncbi:MAG: hypothetical protein RIC55_31595 [Pirellulaceae bacterium]